MSEVDRLEPDDRTLLRYAAVLGVRFPESMLREIVVASDSATVAADIGRLSEFVQHEDGDMWRFRHALTRDVAYAGPPYRLRRQMHDHAGRVLEAASAHLEENVERLSMHFFFAGDWERARTYSRLAGRHAHSQYVYTAAIEFFERAIESGRASRLPSSPRCSRPWATCAMLPDPPAPRSPPSAEPARTAATTLTGGRP